MNLRFTKNLLATSAILTGASNTLAHDGHGFMGAHWHATDAWGFAALGAAIAVALWLSRGRK